MKPIFKLLAVLMIFSSLVLSCENQFIVPNGQDSVALTEQVIEAKAYFLENYNKNDFVSVQGRAKLDRKNIWKNLLWEEAHIRQMSFGVDALVIPVIYETNLSLMGERLFRSFDNLTNVLIYELDGQFVLEVVTTIPSNDYLDADAMDFEA